MTGGCDGTQSASHPLFAFVTALSSKKCGFIVILSSKKCGFMAILSSKKCIFAVETTEY